MTSRRIPPLLLFLAAIFMSGCRQVGFYTQAIAGQWQMLASRVEVTQLLADPATDEKLRKQLTITQEIRSFAQQHLHLPAEKQYATYADIGRKHAVWVVFAAPEFSVTPKTWWYPIVGKLDYRGYFAEADAERFAQSLRDQGLDVIVGGVDAYSTLGFFSDPLLNTFINDSEIALAELIFHELTHQKYFRSGDTEFNEAFATATSQEGVRRWLRWHGRKELLKKYERLLSEEDFFVRKVLSLRQELKEIYSASAGQPTAQRRSEKAAMMARFKAECMRLPELKKQKGFRKWFDQPLNNARINTINAYHTRVPEFHRLLADCGGDLQVYFDRVKRLEK